MDPRTGYPKWAVGWLLAALAAAAIILAVLLVQSRIRKTTGRPLDAARRKQLRDRLDRDPRSIFTYDPALSYRLKPGFRGIRHDSPADPHRTTSRGLLGGEEFDPDPGVEKVLFLGDSVAYGSLLPFEDIFVSRMEAAAGESWQLLNAGCPGWSTHQELEFYRLYLSDLPFAKVVIVFTLNDLLRFEWVWRDERSFQMSPELRGLGGLLQSRLTDLRLSRLRDRLREDDTLRPLAELNNTCLLSYLPEAWERYREEIGPGLAVLAGEAEVILLAVPARPQLEALDRGADPEKVLYPQRRLQELARETGIGYLDLLPALRAGDGNRGPELFLPGDSLHLSARGHQRAARWLQTELLRPTSPGGNQ